MAISVWILSLIHLLGNVCGNRKMLRTTRARSGLKSISLQSTHLSHQRLHSKQRFIIPTLMKRDRYVVEFFLCFSLRHLHFLNTLSTIKQLFSHNFVGLFANYQCWKLETCNKNRPSDSSSCRLGERSRTRTSVEVTVMCNCLVKMCCYFLFFHSGLILLKSILRIGRSLWRTPKSSPRRTVRNDRAIKLSYLYFVINKYEEANYVFWTGPFLPLLTSL